MAKLYGNLITDKGKTSRTSTKSIRSSAQSYDGSIAVELQYVDGKLFVSLDIEDQQSTAYPRTHIYYGPWEEALEKFTKFKEEQEKA